MQKPPERTTILARMESGSIFSIERKGDDFRVMEECDCWYQELLTRDELRQLGRELLELADAE